MKPADRIGMLNRQSCQIAAGALPGRHQNTLAFNGDRVRDENAAGAKRRLGSGNHRL